VTWPAVDNRVVLIADRVETFETITIDTLDLEFTEREYFDELSASLARVSRGVVHYEQPEQFVERVAEHREDIVLSLWSGMLSRNRKALVPAICEAMGIRYVGADSYTNVICQDKSLAKVFCRELNIDVPLGHLIMNHADLALIELLRPPLVVKPNFEGGSIGISSDNLAQTHEAAASLCKRLLRTFTHGVLAEEFVRGREICIVLSGCGDDVEFARAVEVVLQGAALDDRIWSFEIKKQGTIESDYRDVTAELPQDLLDRTFHLFRRLNKVDLLRVDGRLRDGRFYMIELSPDTYLGSHGAFAQAFTLNGYTYDEMVAHLLLNAAASPRSGSASMTRTRDRTGSTRA
jgi:D-alanine-D-alanine ligase